MIDDVIDVEEIVDTDIAEAESSNDLKSMEGRLRPDFERLNEALVVVLSGMILENSDN